MRQVAMWFLVVALPFAAAAAGQGEGELWPVGLEHGACVRNAGRADVLVWAPPGARRLRALLVIIDNTDSKHFGEHAAVRAVAARREMGIVYLRCSEVIADLERRRPGADKAAVQSILDAVAERTGIAEFRHAPWVTFGKSSMGKFPFYMAWAYPKRTIATISYHAETPTWPAADWARLDGETILHVSVNGETEWGGTWNRHVRPSLLNYRARKGWLAHQVVVHDVGHGNYPDVHGSPGWGKPFPGRVTCIDVWNYLALWLDKAIAARVPTDAYPTNGPVTLKQLDEATGFAIDPFAVERLFRLPRYPLVRSDAGYLVDPKGEEPEPGFAAIPAAKGYAPAEGVPVVAPPIGRSPTEWLITEGLDFDMKQDPMVSLGELASLRPKPGDTVRIDDREAAFEPIPGRFVRREGGIQLNAGLQKQAKFTMLAYTVVNMPETRRVRVKAPYTQSGRVQVVLNGMPVAHRQVVELEKGLYPMLVVVRLRTKWASLETCLEPVTEEEVEQARRAAAEQRKREADVKAEQERDKPIPLVQQASALSAPERRDRFWVLDRELAEAWLTLHDVHGIAKGSAGE